MFSEASIFPSKVLISERSTCEGEVPVRVPWWSQVDLLQRFNSGPDYCGKRLLLKVVAFQARKLIVQSKAWTTIVVADLFRLDAQILCAM